VPAIDNQLVGNALGGLSHGGVLATAASVFGVGVGVRRGLVRPMESVWSRWIQSLSEESGNVRRKIDLTRARDGVVGGGQASSTASAATATSAQSTI
jgi:hypothetical protein